MSVQRINPGELARPSGFSHAVSATAGRTVFLAGQTGTGPDGKLAGGGIVAQFEQALGNLLAALAAAGGGPQDLVSLTIYLADIEDYQAHGKQIGAVWRRLAGHQYPAMAAVEVVRLWDSRALVELQGIAAIAGHTSIAQAGPDSLSLTVFCHGRGVGVDNSGGADTSSHGDALVLPESAGPAADAYVDQVKESLKQAADEIEHEATRDVLVFVVGEANAGKTSIINGLLGEAVADVSAIPGTTRKADLYVYSEHLFVVDTPGLNEADTIKIGKTVIGDAKKRADIIMFVLNLSGNRTPDERKAFKAVQRLKRPVILVGNKVDTLKHDERAAVVDDISRRFTMLPSEVILTSASTGEGLKQLALRVFTILDQQGGGLLWAKNVRFRDDLVRNVVRKSAASAMAIAAVPIPLADIVPLTALQTRMVARIASIYGYDVPREAAKTLTATTATGAVGRGIFRQTIKTFGLALGIGATATSAIAASVAGAMTYGLGMTAREYYRSGMAKTDEDLKSIYRTAYAAYKNSGGKPEEAPES